MAKIPRNARVRVVILASPGMGHIIPSLELAKCLVSSYGVHVTFFAPTATATGGGGGEGSPSTAQSQLLLHTQSLPHHCKNLLNIINLPPVDISNSVSPDGDGDGDDDTDIVTRISTVVRESLSTIRSIIEKLPQRHSIMIADLFATDAFLVADALKMEKYFFFTSNVTALAIIAYHPKLLQYLEDQQPSSSDELLLRVPGCKTYRVKDLGDSFLDHKSGAFKCATNHALRFVKASGVLVNTFQDLEKHTINLINNDEILRQIPLPPVYTVGPMIRSSSSSDGKSDCLMWLDTQPCDSVLFVSFGSGGTLSAEQLNELAWGLELSQQRFIWVVRKPIIIDHIHMVSSTSTSSYLTASACNGGSSDPYEYLPDGFLNRTRGRGMVVSNWAPQIEILRHPAVGGFLSHCGWNSTLESIVHGVPLIPWPLFAEQHLNALVLCDDLKVAVGTPTQSENGIVGRDEIERVVRLLMEGDEGKVLRSRAKQLQTSATEAVNEAAAAAAAGGGSSYNALSRVVEKWMES